MKTFKENLCPVCQNKLSMVIVNPSSGKYYLAQGNLLKFKDKEYKFSIEDSILKAETDLDSFKVVYLCNKDAIKDNDRLSIKSFNCCYSKTSIDTTNNCNLDTLEVEQEALCVRDRVGDKETIYALNINHKEGSSSDIKKLNVEYPIVNLPIPITIQAPYLPEYQFVDREHFLKTIETTIETAAILT